MPRRPGQGPRDLSKPLEQIEILVEDVCDGWRLDRTLQHYLPWRSRTGVVRLIDGGYVDHRGETRASRKVVKGEVIVVRIPMAPVPDVGPTDCEIPILHEDEWVVVVDKPAGLAVHPAGKRVYGTLIHFLHKRYRSDRPEHDVVPRLLHRIDRETSGVLAAGLEEISHGQIRAQFEERTVRKVYLAVVHGCPKPTEGVIDLALGPARRSEIRLKQEVRDDGLRAETHYRVVETNGRHSLVELTPHTGRTHQLRVHMAAIGCPLVGDKLYGVREEVFLEYLQGEISEANREQLILDRHALHSARLRFWHPGVEETVEYEAPLPADMAALLER
ncbi:MAG: RluA family pseudouridine synthase [Planctomycetes bacterium]|nr:RluA family pseudouridine synthase [Planctomycetota bacterium]